MLGAGNGQFIINCAKLTQAKCIGIEIEESRCIETYNLIEQELKVINNDNNKYHDDDDDDDDDNDDKYNTNEVVGSAYRRCHMICCNALEYNNYHDGTCFFLYLVPRGLRLILPQLLDIPHKIRIITYMSPLPNTVIRNRNNNKSSYNRKVNKSSNDDNNIKKDDIDNESSCDVDVKDDDNIHKIDTKVDINSNHHCPPSLQQIDTLIQYDNDLAIPDTHLFTPNKMIKSLSTSIYDNDNDDEEIVNITKEEEVEDVIIIKPLAIYRVSTASHPDALWPLYYYELN